MKTCEMDSTPSVLYIMGAGRSGSTILNILLGSHSQIEAVGEAKHWAKFKGLPRDFQDNDEGQAFWKDVLKEYSIQEKGPQDFEKLECLRCKYESHSKFFHTMCGIVNSDLFKEYSEHVSNLFSSIRKISGKNIILDSSKNICRALNLLKNKDLSVMVIHLIRDPRGIVWSFMKKNVEHKPKKPFKAILDYIILNMASSLIRYLFRGRVIKVKYEDLSEDPQRVVKRIFDFMGVDCCRTIKMIENEEEFSVRYLIDGNRIRKNKSIKFKPDQEWMSKLHPIYKFTCKVVGWPIYFL